MIRVETYLEWCERKGKKPSHANNLLEFKEDRVFEDNYGNYYFDSLDEIEWSDVYNAPIFRGIDTEILTELEWSHVS